VVLTVDGKEYAQPLLVENDPAAEAVISGIDGAEQEDEEVDLVILFIPKAKD
jgi:hypothetical protein